jgi:hypothetical protein
MGIKFESILSNFGVSNPSYITQIYRSAWDIGDTYVLKANDDKVHPDKSILLNRLLLSEGIPVIEYIDTTDGRPYIYFDEKYWCLMKKIKGTCFDPFAGELKHNGMMLGKAVAKLHKALKSIENKIDTCDTDFSMNCRRGLYRSLKKTVYHSIMV